MESGFDFIQELDTRFTEYQTKIAMLQDRIQFLEELAIRLSQQLTELAMERSKNNDNTL